MEIRELKTKDIFVIVDMFKKLGDTKLSELMVSDPGTTGEKTDDKQSVQFGAKVLMELYNGVIDDLKAWFADLVNATLEEYMEMPATTTLDIIESLTNLDSESFFSRALQLYKKISKSGAGGKKK